MVATRTDQAQSADHASAAPSPSSLEETAAREQEQAASAAPPGTYHGPVDSASDDNADFDNLSETSRAEDGQGEFVGPPAPPAPRAPRQQQVVLGSFSERQVVEREGGVSATAPLRYGVKAMRIALNINQGYLAEIQADIAGRGTPKLRVETQHLNAWLSVPEIILLVNPSELSWSLANKVQETRTRGGFVQEFWAGELETLSAEGQSAVAYVVRNDGHPKGQGGGLTIRDLRSGSAGYRNLRRLVDVYRSNGVLYGMRAMGNYAVGQGDEKPVFRKTLLYNGYVQVFYDGVTYSGFFENFEIMESGDMPFWLTWSFTFKVETVTGRDLKVFDSGKFLSPQSGPAEFSSMSAESNTTGQRNM